MSITDDLTVEEEESFYVTLETDPIVNSTITIESDSVPAVVIIRDNDGMYTNDCLAITTVICCGHSIILRL